MSLATTADRPDGFSTTLRRMRRGLTGLAVALLAACGGGGDGGGGAARTAAGRLHRLRHRAA